jgi:hypothetical protein
MILAFEFRTRATHGVLENILAHIVKSAGFNLDLRQNNGVLSLFVEGQEDELLSFSDKLSSSLPLSIFIQSFNVKVVNQPSGKPIEVLPCKLFLPFTPNMVAKALDEKGAFFYNPFIPSEVGLDLESDGILTFTCKDEEITSKDADFKSIFEKAAALVHSGQSLQVTSATGSWTLRTMSDLETSLEDAIIMPTDLSVVEKMVVVKEEQIQALASLEKPVLRLNINAVFASKEIIKEKFVNMRMADDLLLMLLMRELFALGVEFVITQKDEQAPSKLTYNSQRVRPLLYVSVLENGQAVPIKSDMYIDQNLQEKLEAFDSQSAKQSLSVLLENSLLNKSVACVYLSDKHKDEIMLYSEDKGFVGLIDFDFADSGQEIMDEISKSTTGKRLIENFSSKYPQNYKAFCALDLSGYPKNLYTILGAAGVLFNFALSVEEGVKNLLDNATLFGGLKGPRIDYLLQGDSLHSKVDALRLFRSGMSFLLADLDPLTLSYGYVDSLGYFISDVLDRIQDEFKTTHVALCGALFGNGRLAQTVARHAKITHTVCFNIQYPVDN